jgi:hypothetical protein
VRCDRSISAGAEYELEYVDEEVEGNLEGERD